MVEGVTAEVKSHVSVIRKAPSQLTVRSESTLNFAAVAQTRRNDTTNAINKPGIRFGAR